MLESYRRRTQFPSRTWNKTDALESPRFRSSPSSFDFKRVVQLVLTRAITREIRPVRPVILGRVSTENPGSFFSPRLDAVSASPRSAPRPKSREDSELGAKSRVDTGFCKQSCEFLGKAKASVYTGALCNFPRELGAFWLDKKEERVKREVETRVSEILLGGNIEICPRTRAES